MISMVMMKMIMVIIMKGDDGDDDIPDVAHISLNLGKGPCTSAGSGVRGGVARVPER